MVIIDISIINHALILWQPLTLYVVTWIKIWDFTLHLKMNLGPGNLNLLFKRSCCGYNEININNYDNNRTKTNVLSHPDRPLDIPSFLGNKA